MRSCSWTAVWYWQGGGDTAPASVPAARLPTCRPTYRRGGQTQDGAVLDVAAVLREKRTRADVSKHADVFVAFTPSLETSEPSP